MVIIFSLIRGISCSYNNNRVIKDLLSKELNFHQFNTYIFIGLLYIEVKILFINKKSLYIKFKEGYLRNNALLTFN